MSYKTFTELSEKPKRILANYESNRVSDHSFHAKPQPVPQMQRTLGNRNIAQLIQAKRLTPEGKIINLQHKLTVGAADDQYEQEADRVARQVINTPDAAVAANSIQRGMPPEEDKDKMLQTKPLAASITPFVQREMVNTEEPEEKKEPIQAKLLTETGTKSLQRQPEEDDKNKMLQTKSLASSVAPFMQREMVNAEEPEDKEKYVQGQSAGSMSDSFEAGANVETQVNQSKSRGSPLPDPVRAYMEPRFGVDFSQVRVHTGSDAVQMNRDVGAHAFTHGSDIYYGANQSPTNLELTAHELTHVIQQTGSPQLLTKKINKQNVTPNPDPFIQRMCASCAAEEKDKKGAGVNSHTVSKAGSTLKRKASSIPRSGIPAEHQQGNLGSARNGIQRRIGDGHDLSSPRFAGDPVLEACFDNEQLLRVGSRGEAVIKLQQALVDAGFPLPKFGVDGDFGSETRSAVRNFQQASGILVDGLVGPQTMGALDARFSGPTPPGPTPPVPPGPTPPGPTPPVPPGPTPPGPTPPVPPGPTPPGPTPAPPESITSQTVVTSPGARTRTTIGVGEEVNLTHAPGSAAWTRTAGTLSAANGVTVIFTAPDTAQRITVTAGTATISFDVIAPTSVAMDREPGTGVKHSLNQPDSGIQTRVFLGPDTVNFSRARYRELDVAGVPTNPGVYSCNTFSTGHCGAGGGGAPCPDKALTDTVVAGMGTQSLLGDCAYSGHCGTAPPFLPGSITVNIPYEYKVGAGAFHAITNVTQVHTLAADASTLTSAKAGATGSTTVAAATVVIPQCP